MVQFDVTYDRGLPEFYTQMQSAPGIARLYGAEMDGVHGVYRYPAYFPFHLNFLADVELLFPESYELTVRAANERDRQSAIAQNLANWTYGINVPKDFFRYEPYEHQRLALVMASNTPRCGWLYDRGLGKTKAAIDLVRMHKLQNSGFRCLIVTPAVTIPNWCEEIEFHSFNEISPKVFLGEGKHIGLLDDLTITLTTYETMRAHWKTLQKLRFHRIIFDESHRLRNPKSSTTQAALELSQGIPLRTIMTGSSHWDPRHLYAQLKILSPALIPEGTYSKFAQKFLRFNRHNRYQVDGFKNMNVLKQRVGSCCIHRTKKECLDLPERIVTPVYVDLSPDEARAYNQVVREQAVSIGTHTVEISEDSIFAQISALLQTSRGWVNESNKDPEICDGCTHLKDCVRNKVRPYTPQCQVETTPPAPTLHDFAPGAVLERAVEMLAEILDEDETNKAIVWFRSNVSLHKMLRMFKEHRSKGAEPLIEDNFDSTGTEQIYTDESLDRNETVVLVGNSDYKAVVNSFENDDSKRVLFGQIKCGIGINLTAANYTLYPELTMNPEDMEQSIDRNYRPGQERVTVVYKYIARGTLDDGISQLLDQKTNIQEALADPNFCERCEKAGKCILNMSVKPGTSECGLQGFVRRSSLKVRGTVAQQFEENFCEVSLPPTNVLYEKALKRSAEIKAGAAAEFEASSPFDMMGDE